MAFLDSLDGAVDHVEGAGFNFVVVAKAPLDRLITFAQERGWKRLHLLSAANNSFKQDYCSERNGQSMPLTQVFHRYSDGIRHFWSAEMLFSPSDPGQDPRQDGTLDMLWNMMDLTPEGRTAGFEEQLRYE